MPAFTMYYNFISSWKDFFFLYYECIENGLKGHSYTGSYAAVAAFPGGMCTHKFALGVL